MFKSSIIYLYLFLLFYLVVFSKIICLNYKNLTVTCLYRVAPSKYEIHVHIVTFMDLVHYIMSNVIHVHTVQVFRFIHVQYVHV